MTRNAIPQYENDVLQSEALGTIPPWIQFTGVHFTNNTTDVGDPNGGSAATKIAYDGSGTAGQALIGQVMGTADLGELNSVGIWMRAASGSFAVLLTDNASLTFLTANLTTTWQFFAVAGVAALSSAYARTLSIYLAAGDNNQRTLYAWGAQAANQHNTVGPYIKTTTTTVAGPIRNAVFDAENDLLQSEALATSPWQVNNTGTPGVTATNNTTDVIDPNGGSAATKVVHDGSLTAGQWLIYQPIGTSEIPEVNSIGLWLRSDSGSFVLRLTDNAASNITMMTLTTTWQLFSLMAAPSVGAYQRQLAVYLDSSDHSAHTFYAWGAQAAIGHNQLGRYVKTTSATVPGPIRNAAPSDQNMIARSQNLDDTTAWPTVNVSIAPDARTDPLFGTPTADDFVETSDGSTPQVHAIIQLVPAVLPGRRYTFTVYAKALQSTAWVTLGGNGGAVAAWYNLVAGTVGTVVGVAASIAAVGNGWYRCSFTYDATMTQVDVYTAVGDANVFYVGSGVPRISVWGVQLTTGGIVRPYVATSANGLNAAVVLRAPQPSDQNLITWSESFDNAGWFKLGDAVVTPDVTVAPNGTSTADKLSSAGGSGYVQNYATVAQLVPIYAATIWLRADSATTVNLIVGDESDGLPVYTTVCSVGTTWQRFEVDYIVTASSSLSIAILVQMGAAGSCYMWGAQLTTGAGVRTYVATTASAVNPNVVLRASA